MNTPTSVSRPAAEPSTDPPPAPPDADLLKTVRQPVTPLRSVDAVTPMPQGELTIAPASGRRSPDTAVEITIESRRPDPAAPTESSPAAGRLPRVGGRFLGFELVRELGRGSFARVFLARQPELADRIVVLKVSADSRAESRALAQLQHANIVPVYSVHQSGPLSALCMPFLGAVTLADLYRDLGMRSPGPANDRPSGPAGRQCTRRFDSVEAVLWLGAQLADGLAHAHERGVLHRDLKPANILLTDEGVPMLFDFNLAANSRSPVPGEGGAGGTLPYMSPEQLAAFLGEPAVVGARSDLFALGVILFELLTRTHPFVVYSPVTRSTPGRMRQDRLGPPPSLRALRPTVSPAVEAIVRKCLAPDPADRYQSARDLREDLDRQLRHLPLRHAADTSVRERLWKWRRRNPALASRTSFWLLAVAAGVALLFGYARLEQKRTRRPGDRDTRAVTEVRAER